MNILLDSTKKILNKTETPDTKEVSEKEKSISTTNPTRVNKDEFYADNNSMSVNDALQTLFESNLFHRVKYDQVNNCTNNRNQVVAAIEGKKGGINLDIDDDGIKEEVDLAKAVASSYDSELDLYIQEKIQQYLGDSWSASKLTKGSEELLKQSGIKIEKVADRVWAASLVDSDGNILEDEFGNKGSILYCDRLVPDGNIQGIEMNFGSILDLMGYDCISKADFLGKEDEYEKVLSKVEANIQQGLYKGDTKTEQVYDIGSSFGLGTYSTGHEDSDDDVKDSDELLENSSDLSDSKEIVNAYNTALEHQKTIYTQENKKDNEEFEISDNAMNLLKNKAKADVINKYGNEALACLKQIK